MKKRINRRIMLAGFLAGAVNGLLGAGGGMLLVPLLSRSKAVGGEEIFPLSVSIILPVCLISLAFSKGWEKLTFLQGLPYLLGSAAGGVAAGILGKKIPTLWLHRFLGAVILLGGIRYLC